MRVDIEETVARELREVAEGLNIPALPRLPEESPRPARRRQPLLAAAAVVTIVAGTGAVVATLLDGPDTEPAQPSPSRSLAPSPSPSPIESVAPIPRNAPEVPYVLDGRLYADAQQVPGLWWSVRPAGEAWIAWRQDYSWWWGRGPKTNGLPNGKDLTPQISPNGRYVAFVRAENREGVLTVVDTQSGKNFDGTPVSLGAQRWDSPAYVVAVTDDGRVVARGGDRNLLWVPGSGGSTVDLSETAPGQMVQGATAAGLVVTNGDEGQPYLAEVTDAGDLTSVGELPEHDDLVVSPAGEWLAWTPAGTTGGEVTSVPSLEVRTTTGGEPATLTAPDGWQFKVRTYVWEDDAHLVSTVLSTEHQRERMVRCSPQQTRCVLIKTD